MESGMAHVVRAHQRIAWPARPLVVAAMNPCPCGYADDSSRMCTCSLDRIERYRARVSGPLLDRFDLHIALKPVEARSLREGEPGESSAQIRRRVCLAHERAALRAAAALRSARSASRSSAPATRAISVESLSRGTEPTALTLLDRAVDALGLSVRAYVKVLRVARTIADLDGSERVACEHMAEAVQYRLLDRKPDTIRSLPYVPPPARLDDDTSGDTDPADTRAADGEDGAAPPMAATIC
jgi:magnesium chelatase family protein